MKAVILAAGIASRLRPLTDNTPKCLLKVGNQSILEYTIENLLANNISDIIIVTGYLETLVKSFVKEKFPQLNITFIYNELFASTNNIYSLWLTKEMLRGDDMLLMDSDIIFDKQIITELINSGYENCLALKRHDVGAEEIKVKADVKGKILEISKEVIPAEAAGESIGIELLEKKSVAELFRIIDHKIIVEKKVNIFYEAAFQELINNNGEIYTVDISRFYCTEIDTASDLENALELMTKNYLGDNLIK
jgi:choline kinase